jgi:hypothetical protein
MADLFKNIAGLGIAAYMGQSRRKSDFDRTNQLRLKNGLPELPWEDAPIDKAMNWVGEKFKTWTGPDAAKAPEVAAKAAEAPVVPGGSEDVGLWERLKAGNIDQEGSEAYKRWGKGKAEGEQRVAELDESSRLEATKDYSDAPVKLPDSFTKEQFSQAPDLAAEPMKMDRFEDINTPF